MAMHRGNPVFGQNLQQAYQDCKGLPPAIFSESLCLLHEGIHHPALFSGQADRKKVQLLQKAWDQGKNPLRLTRIHDYSAVSDCLLNWLNSLPSPVIPCRLFHAFLHVHQTCSHSQWVHQLQALFDKLELYESDIVVPLLAFLHDYDHFHRGKSFRNPSLGQIFGSALLKAHGQALPLPFPEDTRTAASLVDCIIADYDLIFRPPQSPCSSPMKKPPSRAKTSPARKDVLQWKDASGSLEEKRKQQFAARMFRFEDVPVRHLRINTSPTSRLQDENYRPANCGGGDTKGALSELLYDLGPCCPSHPSTFQSIPEEDIDEEGDGELQEVVGTLLCGSLSGMLFEPDDKKFLERTSSIITTSSPSVSCYQSEMSADLSSDEELVQFCP